MSSQEKDIMLVEAAKNGSQYAYAKLLKKYKHKIFTQIMCLRIGREDAEDLTMEIFAEVFVKLHYYKPTHLFWTWLSKIARNRSMDYFKKKKRKIVFNEITPKHDSKVVTLSPEQIIINSQQYEYVNKLVNKLKPRYREVVLMRCYYDYSFRQISGILNTNEYMVRMILHRARRSLNKMLIKKCA
jgi:RNA polymerase sigma-70 factor (ECF subfamily)